MPKYENSQVSLAVLLGLAIFFGLYAGWFKWHPLTPDEWLRLGGLDAGRALFNREWYRVITALTLHSDSAHLFGNLFFGGLVAVVLCRQIGAGFGWLLILLSGILGNALITILRGGPHLSIGASTALLGAMGVLCGFTFFSTEHRGWRRIVLPLAAALAWLAFLGSEGKNTDLGAHFTGMLCGLPLGMCAGFLFKHRVYPSPEGDRILGALALVTVALAWFVAFVNG
jgi:membrane associated rhomboid family serine protease